MLFGAAAIRVPLVTIGLIQYIAPTMHFVIGVAIYGEAMPPGRVAGFAIVWIALIVLTIDAVGRCARGRARCLRTCARAGAASRTPGGLTARRPGPPARGSVVVMSLLTIRRARPEDDQAFCALATIDSAMPLAGDVLVAQHDGAVIAAISLEDGRSSLTHSGLRPTRSRCCVCAPAGAARAERVLAQRGGGCRRPATALAVPPPTPPYAT